jgi:fatty-acyl-CoA synthase
METAATNQTRRVVPGPGVEASYEPLTPTAFLARAALVHRDRPALVDGDLRLTYAELWSRARQMAGALEELGVGEGDRVAVLATNSHLLLEAHYGVPLAGAVLVALNLRLGASELAYILEHSGARLLLCDPDLESLAADAARRAPTEVRVVSAGTDYEDRLTSSTPLARLVADERDLLALNYTSGTTGRPKGVMYHHRGAYLQALAMALHTRLRSDSVFLWTLPMFHCNGWCFTWAVTAVGATHLCLPKVDPDEIWRLIEAEGVTHFNAAPTVLGSLAYHSGASARTGDEPIRIATGGAPPSPTLLERLGELGMDVTHLYGLTETFGPIAICEWLPEWDDRPAGERARLKARQGVPNVIAHGLRAVGEDGDDVPADGETMGEILVRGNDVMLGYYRDEKATEEALAAGWFRTGDLGVMHPDGYVELRDRAKDVIISGGENIASVEVEQAIVSHPAVLEAAVIPIPDEKWGERPGAYVTLKEGAEVSAEELAEHVRERLARFKVPQSIRFCDELPKTSTGKIQKYLLRDEAWGDAERRIG